MVKSCPESLWQTTARNDPFGFTAWDRAYAGGNGESQECGLLHDTDQQLASQVRLTTESLRHIVSSFTNPARNYFTRSARAAHSPDPLQDAMPL